MTGIPKRTLVSTSEVRFFDKLGFEINFSEGENGKVTHLTIRPQNGRENKWKKVK